MGFLFLNFAGGGAGLINQFGGLLAGLDQHFARLGLSMGQLLLDLLGVVQAFLDAFPALFQHGQDRLVGVTLEQKGHDGEADALRDEMRQVHTEPRGGIPAHLGEVTADASE